MNAHQLMGLLYDLIHDKQFRIKSEPETLAVMWLMAEQLAFLRLHRCNIENVVIDENGNVTEV